MMAQPRTPTSRLIWRLATILLLHLVPSVDASPASLPTTTSSSPSASSTSGNPTMQSDGFQPAIYIPIIILIAVLVGLTTFSYMRQRLRAAHLQQVYSPGGTAQNGASATTAGGARQLTASQLVTNPTTTTTTTTSPTGTRRAARRGRRRASQISVTSLPLYMEEAGDQELVLVSHKEDEPLEDPMPANTTTRRLSDALDEDDVDLEAGTHIPMNNLPSVDEDAAESHSRSQTSLLSIPTPPEPALIPSDNTPSYEEALTHPPAVGSTSVIDLSDTPEPTPRASRIVGHTQESSTASSTATARPRSGILSFFHLPTRTPRPPPTSSNITSQTRLLAHQRSTSSFSFASMMSLTPTTSRNSSSHPLPQPHPSLSNISLPLAHTLTRTTFAYPSSGPTEDQMRFLGSRESLGRFGVPYGDAARRWAGARLPAFEGGQGGANGDVEPEMIALPESATSATGRHSFADDSGSDMESDDEEGTGTGTGPTTSTPRLVVRSPSPTPPSPVREVPVIIL